MAKKILLIMGHPARNRKSFCEALAESYQEGAQAAGHEVHMLKVVDLQFDPILHEGYDAPQDLEPDLVKAQAEITWADHIVIVYPMWQFMIPALLKGFMERTFVVDFAYSMNNINPFKSGLLKGKTAQIIQTMGMPALFYRIVFLARGARVLLDGLNFCGIKPIRATYLGSVGDADAKVHQKYLDKARRLGERLK